MRARNEESGRGVVGAWTPAAQADVASQRPLHTNDKDR